MVPETITIQSGQGAYAVSFCRDIAHVIETLRGMGNLHFVVDRRVSELHAEALAPLQDMGPVCLLEADEEEKTLAGVGRVAAWLQSVNATRQAVVVAIGGGIIQDIASFTTHIYYRGISWIFVPTTLLSMSDSCIGAKCCLNHEGFKNQLGVFWAAQRVLVATDFLETLGDLELASGYGEILKLMLTASMADFRHLQAVAEGHGMRNADLPGLLHRSLCIKKSIIEVDEYEKDLRRILNYGHTFGHALEKITDHGVPHGQAVAWGLDLVNHLAVRRGWLDQARFLEIHAFVARWLSCGPLEGITGRVLIEAARRDKKVADGNLVLSVLHTEGGLAMVKTPFSAALEAELDAFLAFWRGELSLEASLAPEHA